MSLSTAEFTLQPLSGYIKYGDSPQCGEMSKGSLVKGDSPRCGEMSRSDKGDSLPSGAGRESANRLRDLIDSLVKGDSPQCGEMSRSDKKGSLVKGAGYERSE